MVSWRQVFGHESPYDNQSEGIELALSMLDDGGYLTLEGACGTGKTMLALTAAIHAIRDRDTPYERAFVVTSVKQQLRQFERDLAQIEATRTDEMPPVTAISLVGKADVCPYHLAGVGGMTDASVYDRCERLRDRTRELVDGGRAPLDLARQAAGHLGSFDVDGTESPYPPGVPVTSAPDSGREVEYCPFYAQYLADSAEASGGGTPIPFEYGDGQVLTPERLVERGTALGTCPHSLMGILLESVEVVIGNYYHVFDTRTVAAFTGNLLDQSTILICDEAHMLEPRVRDLASERIAIGTLHRARDELATVIEAAKGRDGRGARMVASDALTSAELDRADLSLSHTFLGELLGAAEAIIDGGTGSTDRIPLRDPTDPGPDRLTQSMREAGYDGVAWRSIEELAPVVEYVLNTLDGEERWRAVSGVGRFLTDWWTGDHETYFRSIDPGEDASDPALALHNCLPADAIAEALSAFGGGILMSATLAPMDVFTRVSGLDRVADGGRPVASARFGLPFPQENRLSLIVDAPKFTYRNRGTPREDTPTRRVYAAAIESVASAPGNVLVGMPSYAEARWAASELETRTDRPVLLDESSDRATTEALKAEFFAGGPKILVTSLRGTLTEGVDYEGDRLAAAVICGVPIINTGDPVTKAMTTAYDRRFGDGFDRSLVVPAVRKARQALGRVIRGPEEVGVRVLVDERYHRRGWDGVRDHLPADGEFDVVHPDYLDEVLEAFWDRHR